ncbi:MAG TPA: glycosyltransferase family 4 protein [Casimicrobiaceae bacterium]|nr:glycosyltransferase family 4 protein [Casimicrobiaceae bacterium]
MSDDAPRATSSGRRRLIVEGWRFVPHSFAMVAQSHCLSLLSNDRVELRFADLPYYDDAWRRTRGIFSADQETALAALRPPERDFSPDATFTLRPERPDFSAPPAGRRFCFGTAEYRVLKTQNRTGLRSGAEVPESVSVIAPSHWPALAYERFGISRDRIHVVPHGIDPAVFRPDPSTRSATREALGLKDAFIYLSIGAMTWNKGIDVLLAAFARVCEKKRNAVLFLKGTDAIYDSRDFLRRTLSALPEHTRAAAASRMVYDGGTYAVARMADLLRAADVYVSPYRAEGFNMPVLEAVACGVPVICTGGGPTDEFTDEPFARRIRSSPRQIRLAGGDAGDYLEPDVDHLVELMLRAALDPDDTARTGAAGAVHVAEHFTWDRVTDRLVDVLFGSI